MTLLQSPPKVPSKKLSKILHFQTFLSACFKRPVKKLKNTFHFANLHSRKNPFLGIITRDALRNLIPKVDLKKHEKHPHRSVRFAQFGTKSYKASHMMLPHCKTIFINPFVPYPPFLYALKTSENHKVF